MSGKFWGNKSLRPIVCLHGWLDNAGTFDRLIPLLPKNYSYLAIDFPGHGRSSWLPTGVPYHNMDFIFLLLELMKEYDWEKISLIGHSLGAYVGFLFASLYPTKVDLLIGIDAIKPPNIYSADILVANIRDSIEKFPKADQRNQEGQVNAYTFEEAIERVHKGSFKSVTKETAPYLLRRGLVPSTMHPIKFCFTRDQRLKYNFGFNLSHEIYLRLAKQINSPFLVVKAENFPIPEEEKYFEETIQTLKENNKFFEYHVVKSSSHHLHLTEPFKISEIILNFIHKFKKNQSHL